MSSHIKHAQRSNIHPVEHKLGTCSSIFSSFTVFTVYPNRLMYRDSTSLQVISCQSAGGRSERTQESSKNGRVNSMRYICTRALHFFLSFAHCLSGSRVIPLQPKATFTRSAQPTLGRPRNCPPLTSAINNLLAIRYLSILTTCPNHLNTL